jgi:hypothetical protein
MEWPQGVARLRRVLDFWKSCGRVAARVNSRPNKKQNGDLPMAGLCGLPPIEQKTLDGWGTGSSPVGRRRRWGTRKKQKRESDKTNDLTNWRVGAAFAALAGWQVGRLAGWRRVRGVGKLAGWRGVGKLAGWRQRAGFIRRGRKRRWGTDTKKQGTGNRGQGRKTDAKATAGPSTRGARAPGAPPPPPPHFAQDDMRYLLLRMTCRFCCAG